MITAFNNFCKPSSHVEKTFWGIVHLYTLINEENQ